MKIKQYLIGLGKQHPNFKGILITRWDFVNLVSREIKNHNYIEKQINLK